MTSAVCPCRRRVEDRSAGLAGQFPWRILVPSAWLLASVVGLLAPPALAQANSAASPAAATSACRVTASWVDVTTGNSIQGKELLRDVVGKNAVILLGESHTDADHHRWQVHTLAGLLGRTDKMVIGFEAFPRRLQGVLDDWVAGKLTADAFLKASEWRQVWGYDAALYLPLFQFARLNRIPMIALNVERTLVSRVGRDGWASVPEQEREGVSKPASASASYQRELAGVYQTKKVMAAAGPAGAIEAANTSPGALEKELDEQTFADVRQQPEFQRFVDAQLTWDRAMAEALAAGQRRFAGATIVGIVGSGHVAGGDGIPHQLKDLGVAEVASLIPVSTDVACKLVGTAYADAVFTLPPATDGTPERPRLGVLLTDGDGGARINQVVPNSVAEAAGLKAGDHVVRAAGLQMRNSGDLVEIVAVQAPGTWLPLSIRRDGQEIDVIAKFPPRPRQDP